MKKSDVLQLVLCILSMVLFFLMLCGGTALNGKRTGGGLYNDDKMGGTSGRCVSMLTEEKEDGTAVKTW